MTSARSAGVMTTEPAPSRSSTLGRVMAAARTFIASRSSSSSSPKSSSPSAAVIRSRTVGASSVRLSGTAYTGWLPATPAIVVRKRSRASKGTRLAMTPRMWAWWACASSTAMAAALRTWSGVKPDADTTSSIGAPRLAAIRALRANSFVAPTSV